MLHINRYPWPSGKYKRMSLGGSNWVESGDAFPYDASPTVWTDLDLSGSIPNGGPVWVLLEFTNGGWISVRPNGDASDVWQRVCTTWGGATFLCRTDANCVVEWKAEAAAAQTVTLIGYVTDIAVPALLLYNAAVPAGFTVLDASAEINDPAMVKLKILVNANAGGAWHGLRPYGEISNWTVDNANSWAWASAGYPFAAGTAFGLITESGALGEIELWASAVGINATITLDSYVQAGLRQPTPGSEVVFPYGATPIFPAYGDLDLSAAVGAQKALVFLKVRISFLSWVTFRKNGSATQMSRMYGGANYWRTVDGDNLHCALIIVACDENGVAEWTGDNAVATDAEVTVLGYIPAL